MKTALVRTAVIKGIRHRADPFARHRTLMTGKIDDTGDAAHGKGKEGKVKRLAAKLTTESARAADSKDGQFMPAE